MRDLCIDFGGSVVKVGIASDGRLDTPTSFPAGATADDLDRVVDTVRSLTDEPIATVAIAVPGLVERSGRGMAAAHGKYQWMLGADVRIWAAEAFSADAIVENDARAALVGETTAGCAIGARDAVILVLGTGIGTAAMSDGVALRGPDGSAGILGGHFTIDRAAPLCNCGNVGCAEVFGATWALGDRIRDRFPGGVPESWRDRMTREAFGFADVFESASTDDAAAAVLGDAIEAWGITAVSLCHAYNPSTLIVAGGVARAADSFVPEIERFLEERLWSHLARPVVRTSGEPDLSVLRGLAAIAAEKGTS